MDGPAPERASICRRSKAQHTPRHCCPRSNICPAPPRPSTREERRSWEKRGRTQGSARGSLLTTRSASSSSRAPTSTKKATSSSTWNPTPRGGKITAGTRSWRASGSGTRTSALSNGPSELPPPSCLAVSGPGEEASLLGFAPLCSPR